MGQPLLSYSIHSTGDAGRGTSLIASIHHRIVNGWYFETQTSWPTKRVNRECESCTPTIRTVREGGGNRPRTSRSSPGRRSVRNAGSSVEGGEGGGSSFLFWSSGVKGTADEVPAPRWLPLLTFASSVSADKEINKARLDSNLLEQTDRTGTRQAKAKERLFAWVLLDDDWRSQSFVSEFEFAVDQTSVELETTASRVNPWLWKAAEIIAIILNSKEVKN